MKQNQYRNAPCNPLIITNRADLEGRYLITCLTCGHQADQWTTDWRVALDLKDTHQPGTRT
jgi:hypothetical protein